MIMLRNNGLLPARRMEISVRAEDDSWQMVGWTHDLSIEQNIEHEMVYSDYDMVPRSFPSTYSFTLSAKMDHATMSILTGTKMEPVQDAVSTLKEILSG